MGEFVTASILGGLLYDATKEGIIYANGQMKGLIKGYIFTPDELSVLEMISNEVLKNNEYTEVDFVNALESNQEAQKIIQNLQENKITVQINNIQTNNGAVMGDNHGTINFGKN